MDLKALIFEALQEKGCTVAENAETGIVEATTPEGVVWDFTVPQPKP